MKLQRKPFLINRAISKFLTASVFSAVAIQLAVMVDAIVVANFVGPDAMSAISVCMPVIGIIVNIGYMISMGSTLLISKAIAQELTPQFFEQVLYPQVTEIQKLINSVKREQHDIAKRLTTI